ncbi:unnamed protein product [Cuscuta epithymum]|uniref:F-box domain-containing protein n=1 Tax=Cuscuta epithymum TaxID=186058 RepID=A0AAV0FGX5_9ASTE|nr:unnamed protein product [Cuscuta epithymum]
MGRKRKSENPNPKTKKENPAAEAPSSPVTSPPPPPWIELPGDVTANILKRLGSKEILWSAQRVCTTWWKVCHYPSVWRVIDFGRPDVAHKDFRLACRRAVDRSQGQLVDLTIECFADDDLLNYIADRSCSLKRLKLESCTQVSGTVLAEALKKFPELEECHLVIMPTVLAKDIEAIGRSCPKLISFTHDDYGYRSWEACNVRAGPDCNDYALAIAKNMPNLQHLSLFAHHMTNDGLEAILQGCAHLKSLDIRQCYCLKMTQDLEKRCRERVKDLRLPSDSIIDVARLDGDEPSDDICPDVCGCCGYSGSDSDGGFEDFYRDYYSL